MSPSHQKPLEAEEAWNKIVETAAELKVVRSLRDAQTKRVKEALEVLKTIQRAPKRRTYQLFLYDVLRKSGSQAVILCAIALGQVKIVNMRTRHRSDFIRKLEEAKHEALFTHRVLRSLVAHHQIPSSTGDLQSIIDAEEHRCQERNGEDSLQCHEDTKPRSVSREPASTAVERSCKTHSGDSHTISKDISTQQHRMASLKGMADVFDEYMCEAIRTQTVQRDGTNYLEAAVTMNFPFQRLVDCLMSLAIHESKVEYLAMALFKVHVQCLRHVRYVVLSNGVKLIPNSEFTLKGASDEAIIQVFGHQIYKATAASRLRKREIEGGARATEGVSMSITNCSSEGAIINLSLGLQEGVQIREILYA